MRNGNGVETSRISKFMLLTLNKTYSHNDCTKHSLFLHLLNVYVSVCVEELHVITALVLNVDNQDKLYIIV